MAGIPLSLAGCTAEWNEAPVAQEATEEADEKKRTGDAGVMAATTDASSEASVRAVSYAYDPGELNVSEIMPAGGLKAGTEAGSR